MTLTAFLRHVIIRALGVLIIAANLPPAEAALQIELPAFQQESLLNGFEILFLDDTDDQSQFLLIVRNGAAFDPIDKWGVTWLTTRMMLRSTEGRTEDQMRLQLQRYQAQIEARVSHDAVYFVGAAPVQQVPEVLDLLGDILTRPNFDEEVFAKVRDELLQERRAKSNDPESLTREVLHSEIFGDNPYARPVEGDAQSFSKLILNDVKIQYRRLFMPNQARLALYYSGDRERLFRRLSRSWGSWVKRDALPFTFRRAPETEGGKIVLLDGPATNSLMRWGHLGVAKNDPDYHALKVFEQYLLLSLPGWASEIGSDTQIQAFAEVQARGMPGYLQLSIRDAPSRYAAYLKRLQGLIRNLSEGRIDSALLDEAKNLTLQDFEGALGDRLTRLQTLLDLKLYDIGAGHITTYGIRVGRVTPERLQRVVSARLSPEDYRIVVSGPVDELESTFSGFGNTEVRRTVSSSTEDQP